MPSRKTVWTAGAAAVLLIAAGWLWFARRSGSRDPALDAALDGITDSYRKVIVLMDGAEVLDQSARLRATAAGRILFYQRQHALEDVRNRLDGNAAATRQFIDYVSRNPRLHDADKLAFLDLVEDLASGSQAAGLKDLKDNLDSIQLTYREEVARIFSQFATRGASGSRERWDAYVSYLRTLNSREKILAEFGDATVPEP
jgi:hypothetical protein